MEVRRQTCQACGSIDVRNILVRETGAPSTVYVRCANCRSLVARYRLQGYYHHGKPLESYMRSLGVREMSSGRSLMEEFHEVQQQSMEGYLEVVAALEKKGKTV